MSKKILVGFLIVCTVLLAEAYKFEGCPTVQNLVLGQEGRIQCQVVGSHSVTWEKKERIVESDRISFDEFGLVISSPSLQDAGDYTVEAFVEKTGIKAIQKIKVNVLMKPTIMQLENMTREEGKVAVFQCIAEGSPRPTMTIRRENSKESIVDNPDEGIELEVQNDGLHQVLSLRINNVKRSDDGLYYCKASNPAGSAERVGHLEVLFRPDMNRTEATEVKTWSSNPVNLSCVADANPSATITWKFQGDPIEEGDERFRIFGTVSRSQLWVLTANMQHYEVFGWYTCEGRNYLGESSIDIHLDEATVPSQITQIVIHKVISTAITFRLVGPTNNGGLPITHYIMQYKLADIPDSSMKTVEWPIDTPYVLDNLTPRAKYEFSAAARNLVGLGPWKTIIYIMPEGNVPEPPLIKTETGTVSKYTDSFEVQWDAPTDNGKPILKYLIRYFKVDLGMENWNQVENAIQKSVDADTRTFQLTGLVLGTYYKIEIRASNEVGISLPNSVIIKTSQGIPPTFGNGDFENRTVEEGSYLVMECCAAGDLPMEYEWHDPSGNVISPNGDLPIFSKSSINCSTLHIEGVEMSHGGVYTCSARNGQGLDSKSFEIVVLKPGNKTDNGTAEISQVNILGVTANSVRFSIRTSGRVNVIEAKYNESSESDDTRIYLEQGSVYEIKDLIPAGRYTFQFRIIMPNNDTSSWTSQFEVTLLPQKPDVIFLGLNDDQAKLQVNRMIDDIIRGTIDKHMLEYYSVQMDAGRYWKRWGCPITVEQPTCAGTSFTIAGLSPRIYYEIQVSAHTSAGYGQPYKQKLYLQ